MNNEAQIEEYKSQILNLNSTIETLQTEKRDLESKLSSSENLINSLNQKVIELDDETRNPKIMILKEDNLKLKEKLKTLKQSVIQLKERLDNDIYSKLEIKSKLLKETVQANDELKQKLDNLNQDLEKLKASEEQLKVYREKYNNLIKDKIESENFATNQEKTIQNLEKEIASLSEDIQNKDFKYKQLDKNYISIIKVIDEYKRANKNIQDKLNKKIMEEKTRNAQLVEKDNEIQLLRSFVQTLKNENKRKNNDKDKDVKNQIKTLKQNYSIQKKRESNDSTTLPLIQSNPFVGRSLNVNQPYNFGNYKIISNIPKKVSDNTNLSVNMKKDEDEANLKEITSLMKQILEQ